MTHSSPRVLLVEDEVIVSWLLEEMLEELGYTVVGPAARVSQALGMIASVAIDAAILDLNLDGEPGYAVADALLARGTPFVFSTGYNKDTLREGYRDIALLQKPYPISELTAALAKLLPARPTARSEAVRSPVGM